MSEKYRISGRLKELEEENQRLREVLEYMSKIKLKEQIEQDIAYRGLPDDMLVKTMDAMLKVIKNKAKQALGVKDE